MIHTKFLVPVILILFFGTFSAGAAAVRDTKIAPQNRVIVYYFYTNTRCPSCHKIENYTRETVEKNFGSELATGKLEFKPLNIDKKVNKHFLNDYELYTKSVVLSLIKKGKEVKYVNLPKVWNYLGDKERFLDYVRTEINKYLREAG
jgi:thiol-disulfide isomerase/thioredoxin